MAYVVLQQVSSRFAQSNLRKTLEKPVALKYLKRYLPEEKFRRLDNSFPDGKVYIWGATMERGHQIERLAVGERLVLFRRGRRVFRIAIIKDLMIDVDLADYLWGRDDSGEPWAILYFMNKVRDISLDAAELNSAMGGSREDNWQGLFAVGGQPADAAVSYIRNTLRAAGA